MAYASRNVRLPIVPRVGDSLWDSVVSDDEISAFTDGGTEVKDIAIDVTSGSICVTFATDQLDEDSKLTLNEKLRYWHGFALTSTPVKV
jgi:hypothetical protein